MIWILHIVLERLCHQELQNSYHEAAARKMAKKLGGTLIKERVGKTIKIRVKF